MTEKIKSLTSGTLIPISAIVFVWYAAVWVLDIKAKADIQDSRITTTEQSQKVIISKLDSLNERLYRIEGLLERRK